MNKPFYHVKKRTLLAIAGCVWLVAGINVVCSRTEIFKFHDLSIDSNSIDMYLQYIINKYFKFFQKKT